MEIGVFAKHLMTKPLTAYSSTIKAHGLRSVHFNLKCAGIETLPETIDDQLCHGVREAFDRHGLQMAAISATYNAIHPDKGLRDKLTRRCIQLIRRTDLARGWSPSPPEPRSKGYVASSSR